MAECPCPSGLGATINKVCRFVQPLISVHNMTSPKQNRYTNGCKSHKNRTFNLNLETNGRFAQYDAVHRYAPRRLQLLYPYSYLSFYQLHFLGNNVFNVVRKYKTMARIVVVSM